MKLNRFSCVLTLVLALSGVSRAGTVSLVPAKDTTIIQGTNPTGQLANGLGDLFSGRTNQDQERPATISIRRSLIYFDIAAAVPSWATITDAKLTMRDVMGNNGNRVTTLHRVQQNWGEGTSYQSGGQGSAATQNDATWLYTFFKAAAPASSPTWTNPGGDFDAAISGSTTVLGGGGGQIFNWTGSGMVPDVQNWLNNPAGNFGWLIRGDESMGQTAKRLNGRTLNNAGDVAPVLMVTFIPEPKTSALVMLMLGTVAAAYRGRL